MAKSSETVCYYHVKQEFQGESTLYQLPEYQRTFCSKQESVRLQTKWLWVRITLLSLNLQLFDTNFST